MGLAASHDGMAPPRRQRCHQAVAAGVEVVLGQSAVAQRLEFGQVRAKGSGILLGADDMHVQQPRDLRQPQSLAHHGVAIGNAGQQALLNVDQDQDRVFGGVGHGLSWQMV